MPKGQMMDPVLPSPNAHAKLVRAMRIHRFLGVVLALFGFVLSDSVLAEEFLPFPENSSIVLAVVSSGVQIYESKPNPAGGFHGVLKVPVAQLKNLSVAFLGTNEP